jgi:uncharacterized protein YjbI with pentapeptide repeats
VFGETPHLYHNEWDIHLISAMQNPDEDKVLYTPLPDSPSEGNDSAPEKSSDENMEPATNPFRKSPFQSPAVIQPREEPKPSLSLVEPLQESPIEGNEPVKVEAIEDDTSQTTNDSDTQQEQEKIPPSTLSGGFVMDESSHITQDQLTQILEDHHRWLESSGKVGRRANFRGMDLTHLDLSNLNMVECSFRGANLAGVNMTYADLRTADMAEADLTGANISGSSFAGANLVRANFANANAMQADFSTCNMNAARGAGASFHYCNLSNTIMRDSHFETADFSHSLFKESNLRGGVFTDAIFNDADLSDADCRDGSFERGHFKAAKLKGTNFKGSNLSGVEMDKTDFAQAQEVSKTYQEESFNQEKAKIAEQMKMIDSARKEFEAREKKLQEERNALETDRLEFAEKIEFLSNAVPLAKKPARWFTISAIIWGLISAGYGFLVFTLLSGVNLEKVKMTEFSIATGIMLGLFLLFFVSMLKAIQVKRVINKIIAVGNGGESVAGGRSRSREPKVFQRVNSISRGADQAVEAMHKKGISPSPKPIVQKSKKGGPFGKKNK